LVISDPLHSIAGNRSTPWIAAVDRSFSGMLVLAGEEAKDFLQRISTNNFSAPASSGALQTVLTDEKGRIVDIVTSINRGSSLLLITSAGRSSPVKAWLEKFIIMEDLTVRDETGLHACAVILGSGDQLKRVVPPDISASDTAPIRTSLSHAIPFSYFSQPALLVVSQTGDALNSALTSLSIPLMSEQAYDDYRIFHGIPEPGREITEKSNPLEAGLRGLVDFSKGCYIGQEVIARLSTYEKVQRRLCSVLLSKPPDDDKLNEIIGEDAVHGYITTRGHTAEVDGSIHALAILRSASAVADARYALRGTTIGVIVETIFT
jgi:tRNA-modifying protein YgfZ